MAWTKTSEGKDKAYAVYSATLYPTGQSQEENVTWTSVIDFIPPGTDFTVIANATSANTSTSAHIELFVGYDKNAPNPVKGVALLRYRRYETPFIRVTSEIDSLSKVLYRDVSAKGQYPYYWLKYATGGTAGGSTAGVPVIMKVIVGKNQESAI